MKPLRKLISILLLAVFGLPFVSPLFAATAKSESDLPACCRRNGKHHCTMSMVARSHVASNKSEFRAPLEKCPFYPASLKASQHSDFGLTVSSAVFGEVISHPAVHTQTKSKWRVAHERSRHKRGPPSTSAL
ncbi:hypothetical protein [Terriglobus sp. ADX1]|uniref:hypothetical protein n=1 Tax=Terriglobus sp. ADX1 TaxID=2794063 RepID=UPI002FE53DE9